MWVCRRAALAAGVLVTGAALWSVALLWGARERRAVTRRDLVWEVPRRLLPYAYWAHRHAHPSRYALPACVTPPARARLHYAAAGWQRLPVNNTGAVYLYSAHWDDRFKEPWVRVLLYTDVTPPPPLICMLWYTNESSPDMVPARLLYAWRAEWGGPRRGVNEPYVAACAASRHAPAAQRPPAAVSLALEGALCDTPTNILNVQGVEPSPSALPASNTSVCVCLKWVHFEQDISTELVEWIEFLKEFGAQRLYTYVVQAHPNTRRVLSYYSASGFAHVTGYTHPPQLRGSFTHRESVFLDYRRELLPLNECLYRARAAACRWLAALDSDEIIVPLRYKSWQEVIESESRGRGAVDALAFANFYYLDAAQRDTPPTRLRILRHRWRAQEPNKKGHNVKSFHNTSSVVAMHNHYPRWCGRQCRSRDVAAAVARLQHYRAACPGGGRCAALARTVRDDAIARYQHVAARVHTTLRVLLPTR